MDANGKTERYSYVTGIAGGIRSLDHNELDANGISIQITPMDEGNVEINEPVYAHFWNGEMVMGGGKCVMDGEPISCEMMHGYDAYLKMVEDAKEKAREKAKEKKKEKETPPIGIDQSEKFLQIMLQNQHRTIF